MLKNLIEFIKEQIDTRKQREKERIAQIRKQRAAKKKKEELKNNPRVPSMRINFTESRIVEDLKTNEVFDLNEEWGVWTWDGNIYVWKGLSKKDRIRVTIHEIVEYVLVVKFKIQRLYAHRIANLAEKIIL